eukprot:6130286-Prymnesium_polylepis.1
MVWFDIEDAEWDTGSLTDDDKSGTKPEGASTESAVTNGKREEEKLTTMDDSKQEDAVVERNAVST